ncbi:hypothetical protein SK128_014758, partial [Halocaridina rubra]
MSGNVNVRVLKRQQRSVMIKVHASCGMSLLAAANVHHKPVLQMHSSFTKHA